MEQLLALDRNGMHGLWDSVWGDRLYHWLRGAETGDDGAPVASEMQKSLGHSHVLGPEFRSDEGAWAVAHKLLHKAAMRLRMEKFYAGVMAVTIKYALTREQAGKVKIEEAYERDSAYGVGDGGAVSRMPGHAVAAGRAAEDVGEEAAGAGV